MVKISEEKKIMDFFGVSQIEGNVRGEHFGKLLTFLKMHSGKKWNFIIRVSPLILGGMQRRYIRENYLEGLIELGIIKIYHQNNEYYYKWFGVKALNGSLVPSESEQVMLNVKQQAEEIAKLLEKEKPKKGYCPNCNKKLPKNKKFCNEECIREYLKKKKE